MRTRTTSASLRSTPTDLTSSGTFCEHVLLLHVACCENTLCLAIVGLFTLICHADFRTYPFSSACSFRQFFGRHVHQVVGLGPRLRLHPGKHLQAHYEPFWEGIDDCGLLLYNFYDRLVPIQPTNCSPYPTIMLLLHNRRCLRATATM